MKDLEHWVLLWSAVSALATAAATLIVAVAALFGYRQLREAAQARDLQSMVTLLSYIHSPDHRQVRRLLNSRGEELGRCITTSDWAEIDTCLRDWSDSSVTLDKFHSYLATLENVAVLFMHGYAPDDALDLYIAGMFLRHDAQLQPIISEFRCRYGTDDFMQHFQMMVDVLQRSTLGDEVLHRRTRSGLKKAALADRRRRRQVEVASWVRERNASSMTKGAGPVSDPTPNRATKAAET